MDSPAWLICAIAAAPHWVLTAVLAITGLGFGPASMSYLLAAQGAVAWQQRGIITSSTTFFRTIGGAIGIGLLGMLFNVLIRPDFDRLKSLGVNPADPDGSPCPRTDLAGCLSSGRGSHLSRADLGFHHDAGLCGDWHGRYALDVGPKMRPCRQARGGTGVNGFIDTWL